MADMSIKQYLFKKASARRIPISGTFELTPRCNLNCRMCYIHMSPDEIDSGRRELNTDEWLELGQAAVAQGMCYLLLTGGEPFLRPDFCELYTGLFRMGLLISVNTNGVCLTDEILDCLTTYKPEKVNVTLYGDSGETYRALCGVASAYTRATENILRLRESGIRVDMNTTFTKLNVQDMEPLIAFAKKHGIPVRTSGFMFPPVRNGHEEESDIDLPPAARGELLARFDRMTMTEQQMTARRRLLLGLESLPAPDSYDPDNCRASTCMAGRGAFWISWDGKMYACGMLPDGNHAVRGDSFRAAWDRLTEEMQTVRLPARCGTCRYAAICPSCAAVSKTVNGASDIVAEDLCAQTEAYVKAFLRDGESIK